MSNPSDSVLIYGVHPLLEIIRAKKRKIYTIYVINKNSCQVNAILKKIDIHRISIISLPKERFERLVNTTDHQGIAAQISLPIIRKKFFTPDKNPLIMILDRINDPRNLGAILRSAYCTGVSGIVLTTHESSPLTASALKASAGLSEHLDVFLVRNLEEGLRLCVNASYCVYSAFLKGTSLYNVKPKKGSCIIVGNEEKGIDKSFFNKTIPITIPQKEETISFNVSVASGIILSYFSYCLNFIEDDKL